jgi:hypothetical protein
MAHIAGNLLCQQSKFRVSEEGGDRYARIALDAESVQIAGSFMLRKNSSAEGGVRLFQAQISGDLDCDGAKITSLDVVHPMVALNAESARIGGSVLLRDGFTSQGEVRLLGATIGGYLACDGAQLRNLGTETQAGSGTALQAEGITVSNSVLLWKGFVAEGSIRFFGARIKGSLVCRNTTLKNPACDGVIGSGIALDAETAEVAGYVQLRNGFVAEGTVRLFRASIGLGLDCSQGKFQNPGGIALNADGARIHGHVLLGKDFESEGVVLLAGAQIEGDLNCERAKLTNPARSIGRMAGTALNVDGIKVGGSVSLTRGFKADGAVRLFAAEIGQNLDCEGGCFRNPLDNAIAGTGLALSAQGCKVKGSIWLRDKFLAYGRVDLFGARVEGNVECSNAEFSNTVETDEEHPGITLDGTGIAVGGNLLLNRGTHRGTVKLSGAHISRGLRYDHALLFGLDLRDAVVGWIADDEKSWPEHGHLSLDGFVYNRISDGPTDAHKRMQWLERQAAFNRQPYRQLAYVLDAAGDDSGARTIQSEMQRRVWSDRRWITRPFSWLLKITIGYGYFPLRAIWLLLFLVLVGLIIYSAGYGVGSLVPNNREAYTYFAEHCHPPPYHEPFNALAYSVENSFPVVKLGAQERWIPNPDSSGASCNLDGRFTRFKSIINPSLVRWVRWAQICCGWTLTTLFVGGVTGLLRRN